MIKQDKIKKVIDEFENGTLKTPDGKVVKSRKQALAIAMSESKDYTEKGGLINHLSINSTAEAFDTLSKAGTEDIFEKAKHQDGDMHPNGKWVWVASANGGKGDWRTHGGRAHSKAGAAGSGASTSKTASQSSGKSGAAPKPKTQRKLTPKQQTIVDNFMDKVKTSDSRYSDPSKVTLWKTPKGNWYVKYDGHQVATIAPLGLTEKIAEAAGMKIDREPSSYQSKKSTTKTKQKKLRPVGTGTLGPTRRTKEEQEKIDKKKKQTKKSPKEEFKTKVVEKFNFYADTSKINISDFITDVKKKGGKHYVRIDYYKMSKSQQRAFDQAADSMKNKAGYKVEDNGGFGKIIGE